MSLTISAKTLAATTCTGLAEVRDHMEGRRNLEWVDLPVGKLDDEDLSDVAAACEAAGDSKGVRAVRAILAARAGKLATPVPNFGAFQGMLESFLRQDVIDGWIYVRHEDGHLYPHLVTAIAYDGGDLHRRKATPEVRVSTVAYTLVADSRKTRQVGVERKSFFFTGADVVNRRIADALAAMGIFKETPELKAGYEAVMRRFRDEVKPGFAKQFRFSGIAFRHVERDYERHGLAYEDRKVVHDLREDDYGAVVAADEGELCGVASAIPEHPIVRVFDLKTHEYLWVHADCLSDYRYDKSLRDKLILPETHRDLLDMLTSDLEAFTADIIEGKAAGNIILCKGDPGLGKTLTAEIYAELTESPLYAIHTGLLGTSAEQIHENLQPIFERARRWGKVVLLLDEADVFVMKRGASLEQNAVVAEFLRELEYFDRLLFMTTNRPNDIDDAIIQRCAAIISFEAPPPSAARAVWGVMATQFGVKLDAGLVEQLLALFPGIAPRDIKMLLRQTLRMAHHRKVPLTADLFRQMAMFRAVRMADGGQPSHSDKDH